MILSGTSIRRALDAGQIVIDPFDESQIGPNSYDFRLGDRCKVYRNYELDAKTENAVEELQIDSNGLIIQPNKLYLINTYERMGSAHFVPIIRGRSSVGRLGLFINITADLIDIGSINQWTLQLHAIVPVRVFPGMLIGQVTFWCIHGDISLYAGKYASVASPAPSMSHKDFAIMPL